MVRLTRIYTRGGDAGQTSLGDGSRVDKHALRVEAYGTVDEANAALGVARLHDIGNASAEYAVIVRSDLKSHGLGWQLTIALIHRKLASRVNGDRRRSRNGASGAGD